MKKSIFAAAFALTLAACGGSVAHAATNDIVYNNETANPAADGRLYSLKDVQVITQNGPTAFILTYSDNTTKTLADVAGTVNGVKFNELKTALAAQYAYVSDFGGNKVLVNIHSARQSSCAGSYLTVNGVTYLDNGCAGYNAVAAVSN